MIATTRGALFRGVTQDALGDEIDDNSTPVQYTDWTPQRVNLALDPRAVGTLNGYELGGAGALVGSGTGPVVYVTDFPGVGTAARITRIASGSAWRLGCRIALQRNALHVFKLRYRASDTLPTVSFGLRPSTASTASGVTIDTKNLPAGVGDITVVGSTLDVPYTSLGGLAIISSNGPIGSTLDVSLLDAEAVPAISGPYFDGDSDDSDLERSLWTGAENGSPSVLETRSVALDLSDFPVSIIERSRNEFDEASNAWRTVRYFAGRVSPLVPVQAGDRIRDNRDGAFYVVDEVERTARGISGRSSVSLTMKRTAP